MRALFFEDIIDTDKFSGITVGHRSRGGVASHTELQIDPSI